MTFKFDRWTRRKNRTPLPCFQKPCVSCYSYPWNPIGAIFQKYHNRSQIVNFSCDLEIWRMTERTPSMPLQSLCIVLLPFFLIKTVVTVRKRSNRVTIGDFVARVTFKFDGWSWTPSHPRVWTKINFDLCDIVLFKGRQPVTNLSSTNRQPVANRTPFSRSVNNQMPTG